jgi:dihydroflavonol-4-reductase
VAWRATADAVTEEGGAPEGPVLVTGGTGFVGGALVERLIDSGRPVRALSRSADGGDALAAAGADPVRGDVLDHRALVSAMTGVETVFHAAGVNAFCLPDSDSMYEVNVRGSANVVRAAAAAGVGRVVYTSSAAVLGEERGTVGNERSHHRGWYLSDYERSKHEAERAVAQAARETGLEVVSVNPASVQGPGRTRGTAKLLLAYLNGRMKALVETRLSIVDIADCTEGHLLAERHGRPGERYVLCGATMPIREAVDLLGRVAGIERPVRMLPPPVARAAGEAVGAVGRLRRRRVPFCREMVRTLLHGHAYDGSRATRELGLEYTPIEESVRRLVAWYREQGLIDSPAE